MDPTLTDHELLDICGALPTKSQLETDAAFAARERFLQDLKAHLIHLANEITKARTLGWASIDVPEVWLPPIAQVLVEQGLDFSLKAPPPMSNMATVTVRWKVDSVLTPSWKPEPPRKSIRDLSIPGIGVKARYALRSVFPTINDVANADASALRAAGLRPAQVRAVLDHFGRKT